MNTYFVVGTFVSRILFVDLFSLQMYSFQATTILFTFLLCQTPPKSKKTEKSLRKILSPSQEDFINTQKNIKKCVQIIKFSNIHQKISTYYNIPAS